MKQIVIWLMAVFVALVGACSKTEEVKTTSSRIYFVDSYLNRLIPYERDIVDAEPEAMAKSALDVLISGEDSNANIRRLIPDDKSCMSVRINGNVAYVDISAKIKKSLPDSRDIERLFVYQIVNTLTEIKGIRFVKFTVDGATKKDFMGYCDMRETYKHKYPE